MFRLVFAYNTFMKNIVKKVLIVGSSAKEYALAKKIISYGNCNVFVAPGNNSISEIANCIDIREDSCKELLEFALENAIDITIASSEKAIRADIASIFQANDQQIFAPSAKSAEITLYRSSAKKFLYKSRISTPHFGVYDKLQSAIDYLKNAPMPQVIHADSPFEYGDRLVCTTFSSAKTFVEDLFAKGEQKIVLEDYVFGHEFTLYIISDGYHAIPLTSVANYKFMENGNGGILTTGIGAFTPDYKISKEIENTLMKLVVNNILGNLQKKGTPYLGILGIDCVLKEDGKFIVLNFKPFLSDHDAQAVLSITEENILELFKACAIGSFADDYNIIKISDNASVSCVISSRAKGKTISGLEFADSEITPFSLTKNKYLEYETIEGKNIALTNTASTLSRARKHLYEDINMIKFDGIKYRTDICEQVEKF